MDGWTKAFTYFGFEDLDFKWERFLIYGMPAIFWATVMIWLVTQDRGLIFSTDTLEESLALTILAVPGTIRFIFLVALVPKGGGEWTPTWLSPMANPLNQRQLQGAHQVHSGNNSGTGNSVVTTALKVLIGLTLFAVCGGIWLTGGSIVDPSDSTTEPPRLRNELQKRHMLELINEARREAGVPPVVMGTNNVAQIQADQHLEDCVSSHWGTDGLKPYHEVFPGRRIPDQRREHPHLQRVRAGGHLARVERRTHRDGDHRGGRMARKPRTQEDDAQSRIPEGQHRIGMEPERLQGHSTFRGRLRGNEQTSGHRRWHPGTRGQPQQQLHVHRHPPLGGCYRLRPQTEKAHRRTTSKDVLLRTRRTNSSADTAATSFQGRVRVLPLPWSEAQCIDPYDVRQSAGNPESQEESSKIFEESKEESLQLRETEMTLNVRKAREMTADGREFSLVADVSELLQQHGDGVYTVLLWASLEGNGEDEAQTISEYSIFHGVRTPRGYGEN